VKNLADVMRGAEAGMEPAPSQPAILDGTIAVVLQAALERTAVVRIGKHPPELVRLDRLEVDAVSLRWTPRTDLTKMQTLKLQAMQSHRRSPAATSKGTRGRGGSIHMAHGNVSTRSQAKTSDGSETMIGSENEN
jgi:hypothetical protein